MNNKTHLRKVEKLKKYLKKLHINFQNFSYYQQALTHGSYSNELNQNDDYQRLEYLGDSIIDKIVCEFLFHLPQKLNEGQMSTIQRMLVQQNTIVRAAKNIKLDEQIFLGKGVSNHLSDKIICDCFEAFIAAIYLDHQGDESIPKKIIQNTLIQYYLNNDLEASLDYKSILQENFQANGKLKIEYKVCNPITQIVGAKQYFVEVWVNQILYGKGTGTTIRLAERAAAKDALTKKTIVDLSQTKS